MIFPASPTLSPSKQTKNQGKNNEDLPRLSRFKRCTVISTKPLPSVHTPDSFEALIEGKSWCFFFIYRNKGCFSLTKPKKKGRNVAKKKILFFVVNFAHLIRISRLAEIIVCVNSVMFLYFCPVWGFFLFSLLRDSSSFTFHLVSFRLLLLLSRFFLPGSQNKTKIFTAVWVFWLEFFFFFWFEIFICIYLYIYLFFIEKKMRLACWFVFLFCLGPKLIIDSRFSFSSLSIFVSD